MYIRGLKFYLHSAVGIIRPVFQRIYCGNLFYAVFFKGLALKHARFDGYFFGVNLSNRLIVVYDCDRIRYCYVIGKENLSHPRYIGNHNTLARPADGGDSRGNNAFEAAERGNNYKFALARMLGGE